MKRDDALKLLAEHHTALREMGVTSLALFGSIVRDEARSDSDMDVLVELERPAGLFKLLEIQHRLEAILGTKVDMVTRGGVHPALRERIFSEALDVYSRATVTPSEGP